MIVECSSKTTVLSLVTRHPAAMGFLGLDLTAEGDKLKTVENSCGLDNGPRQAQGTCEESDVTSCRVMGNKVLDVSRRFQADHTATLRETHQSPEKNKSLPLPSGDGDRDPSLETSRKRLLESGFDRARRVTGGPLGTQSSFRNYASNGSSRTGSQEKGAGVQSSISGDQCNHKVSQKLRLSTRDRRNSAVLTEYVTSLRQYLLQKISGKTGLRRSPTPAVADFFVPLRRTGTGHVGSVTLCEEKGSGKKFACKTILKNSIKRAEDVDEICSEIITMMKLQAAQGSSSYSNIVNLHEVFEDSEAIHLIMEYCEGGDLFDYIVSRKTLTEEEAAQILRQLAGAVSFMHQLGFIHRDLKPENILLVQSDDSEATTYPTLKLADFGLSIQLQHGQLAKGTAGSPFYMAPEVVTQKLYGLTVDVWSMGVILYTCLSGRLPFWGATTEEVFQKVLKGKLNFRKDPWPAVSVDAKHLICGMLHPDPHKRLSLQQVLSHPWMVKNCLNATEKKGTLTE